MDFLSLSQGRQVRGREAAQGRRGRLSLHRPERLRVHADRLLRRARPVRRATCDSPAAIRARGARARASRRRSSPPAASTPSSRPRRSSQRGERRHRRRRRASRSPTPTGSARCELGRGAEVRRCDFTNYCEGLDQQHKQVTCKLWDREALDEPGVRAGDATASAACWRPIGRTTDGRDMQRHMKTPYRIAYTGPSTAR